MKRTVDKSMFKEETSMERKTYLIKVLTPLHVGAGQGLGHVDLPVVREAHTNFPYIPGTAIKGAIREYWIRQVAEKKGEKPSEVDKQVVENKNDKDIQFLVKVFGSAGEGANTEEPSGGSGRYLFTDAKVLLFPVKSVKGIFALITCPYVIKRFAEDTDMDLPSFQASDDIALVYKDSLVAERDRVLLEEFLFKAEQKDELSQVFEKLPLEDYQKRRIVCVSDTVFKDMVSQYTEIQTHIKINPDTGTVSKPALWTQEYVPTETVFYFNLFVREEVEGFDIPQKLHLGGDITTGKGFVSFREVKT